MSRRARFERWVRAYREELYRFAYRASGAHETAEDLVQETFYHAWKGMGRLRGAEKARAWLYQILRFRYAHWARGRRRSPTCAAIDGIDASALTAAGAPVLERLSDRDALQRALETLNEEVRLIILMVFVEGLTTREVAERLDVPLGTVLSRIHRARRRLREVMAEELCAAPVASRGTNGAAAGELRLGGAR